MPGTMEPCVFVIDDEEDIRGAVAMLVKSVGLQVQTFVDATEFLEVFDPDQPGCLVVDVRLPGTNGLQLQRLLNEREVLTPFIFISGHGDIPLAVRAVRNGALDFIEKPFRDEELLACVQYAVELDRQRRAEQAWRREIEARLETLTPREREVLDCMVAGMQNKAAARELGISIRTVEIHRSRILHKLDVEQVSEVVRMVLTAQGNQ